MKEEKFIYITTAVNGGLRKEYTDLSNPKLGLLLAARNIHIAKGVYLENGVILHDNVSIGDNVNQYAKYSGYIEVFTVEEKEDSIIRGSSGHHFELKTVNQDIPKEGYKVTIGRDTVVHSGVNIFQ